MAQSVESACSVGDLGSIPGSGRFPEEGDGNPLQYSCLENTMDRGAWWTTVHGITESDSEFFNVGVNSDLRFAFVDKSGLRIYEAGSSVE